MKRRDFALLTLAPLAAPVWARNPAFAPLTERFLEALWQMDPDAAVAAGRFEFAGRLTLPSAAQRRAWLELLQTEHAAFREQVVIAERFSGAPTWLDPYGAENPGEFLAVAGEAYFVNRERFAQEFPRLLTLFDGFFRPTGG